MPPLQPDVAGTGRQEQAAVDAIEAMSDERKNPTLLVLSETSARAYEPSGREVCISITNPRGPAPKLSERFVGVLRLSFTDIAGPSPFAWDALFNEDHARQIISFMTQWPDIDRVVVHCMAGQSRSAGVAMGLCDVFGWPLEALEQQYPLWNTWVRSELARVGADRTLPAATRPSSPR
jgi:predicted protein tyrosine phosphatase